MVSRNDVLELHRSDSDDCISIFIPTHRAGQETLRKEDSLHFKNELKAVHQALEEQGMKPNEIENFIKPANDLLQDGEFWRHQSDGLAVYLSEKGMTHFTVPLHFEKQHYIGSNFYLKPLMPLVKEEHPFYLLTLQQQNVRLFEGREFSIQEIVIEDKVPTSLEEQVGKDYEEKSLQFRSQQGGQGEGLFHGQNIADSEAKEELKRYFRAIDKGIAELLGDQKEGPLVLCCFDSHYPIYKEVSHLNNLHSDYVSGNPAKKDALLLHEEAQALLQPYFHREKRQHLERCKEVLGTGKASSSLSEILPAVLQAKVEALFLEKDAEIYGTYDPKTLEVNIHKERNKLSIPLLNFMAAKVYDLGGSVHLLKKEEMPDDKSNVTALYRF